MLKEPLLSWFSSHSTWFFVARFCLLHNNTKISIQWEKACAAAVKPFVLAFNGSLRGPTGKQQAGQPTAAVAVVFLAARQWLRRLATARV